MTETRIKISSIIENQLPQFVLEEFPLVSEFLSQYYISLENQGNASDLLQNIDKYVKVDNLTNLIESTELNSDVTFFDTTINVTSTVGFPESYGLLLIDSEIITYTSKTSTTFEGCIRGFSGVTSYETKDQLTFTETRSQEHFSPASVINLSILFLKEFLTKIKKQVTPGFEERELYSDLNENLFIKQSIDFYSSKGTDNSFKILFGALYGQNVEVIKPRDYLIQPSDAQYRITSDLVVEEIEGNPENLVNRTIYQKNSNDEIIAQGTVTKVEKIRRGSKNYYVISLDYGYNRDIQTVGTVYGNFVLHPKTKTTSATISNSNTIDVDSTVGFPKENGNIIVDLENGTSLNITYTSKTLNQFFGCVGIEQDIPEFTEIKTNEFAYGYVGVGTENQVKIRITGVLSDLNYPDNSLFYSKEDTIKIKTLGIDLKNYKSNNWFFNIPVKYVVSGITTSDNASSGKLYNVTLSENHSFKIGDSVTFIPSSGNQQTSDLTVYVTSFNDEKSFTVQFGSEQQGLDPNLTYTVKKNLSKVSAKEAKTNNTYPKVNQYTSNVQNVYYENEKSIYVSSPSLPTYLNQDLKINDRIVIFSGTFTPDDENDLTKGSTLDLSVPYGPHGLYTGDSIVYKPTTDSNLGISTGIYFIKKISDTQVKLAKSRSNIFVENFIPVNGTVTNAKFELTDFTYRDLSTQLLESQKLIRKITSSENDGNTYETDPGLTGIFINGVEVLNYKSKDNIYYGPIEKIIPVAPGSGYDIINPPPLTITDPIGSGATAYCSVIGGLERIDIIDPGFDYLEDPKIDIIGGNGSGAAAVANLVSFDHQVSFNSSESAGLVKLNPTNTIGFSSYHKFRDAEEVVYITNGQSPLVGGISTIAGLSTNSTYFVSVQDAFNIKLHKSFEDAVAGINTFQLTSYGTGTHSFRSKNKKKKIGSITIKNRGSNYQNKLTTTNTSGINTSFDVIIIKDHGYKSGEIIVYNATESPIGGLSSNTSYYVTKINDDQFRLSQLGIGTLGITTSFYYDTRQYINLTSIGSGTHKFNYPEIKVVVRGRTGVSTFTGQDFNAVVQPIFRGEIQSTFIQSSGQKYGSEEIINYNRQPLFNLNSGSGIELTPIVSNGQIVDVLINSPGSGYNSPPTLQINGTGIGAILTPILSNGSLSEVKIIYGGIGYQSSNTSIDVIPAGNGAKLQAEIKSWKINLVERLLQNSQISDDDGILSPGLDNDYGLEYTHAYAPRRLRSLVQTSTFRNGRKVYVPDLQYFNGELTSTAHSPIIGWAYDGNPIYGPYGFLSKTGGAIKCLTSGYELTESENRINGPDTAIYPLGFFIEDYVYTGKGDLDEHNGRFGVTPEYPNGVYAYFTTINDGLIESGGLFAKYKKPIFPYIIGNTYKSKPIDFNFESTSNQDNIDINQTGWRRNISPYNISLYDYVLNPNSIKQQNSIVKTISTGSVDSIGIETGGKDYKVGDKVSFSGSSIQSAKAKVSLIKGKSVNQISVATSSFNNVQFYPYNQEFIGFTSIPHNYSNNDLITFTGKYDYKKSGNITVNTNNLSLTTGVGSAQYTGLVTYFNVAGNLNYPNIRENDIYQIGSEEVKVLNIDQQSSRIRVLRNQNGTAGVTSYSAGIALTEKTRKFKLNFGISTSYNFDIDREFYFDPKESVGLGTTSGIGIVSTVYFSSPGVGITQLTIPTQSIYIKNHNLNTGDSLIYSSNGGDSVSVSTNGFSSFTLGEKSVVYVAKISNDLIGISTIKVGVGSTGTFVSVGSTLESSILYFTSVGTGNTHSFKTNYTNTLSGQISKNVVTVSTAETHGLSLFDNVTINVRSGISTTHIIKYDDYNRRLIVNPRSFSAIDTADSIITINNHGYYNGQKVIYTSSTPSSGLVNEGIYYAVVIDPNKIKLANSYYQATKSVPEVINILTSQPGIISPINPTIDLIKNQTVVFDLSDTSLSFINAGITYSAFDFKIYKDNQFKEEFNTTESSTIFELTKTGNIGIDSTAKVTLSLNENVPINLYYKLIPINPDINSQIKKEIIVDNDVPGYNQLTLLQSGYNGNYSVVGVSSTTFKYNILETPESTSYFSGVEYFTNSTSAIGPISKVTLTNRGRGYSSLPGITSIVSDSGIDAILNLNSNSIGKITSIEIQDIGFEYPSDYSIRPTSKLPEILILDSLSTFDYIGISSFGRNYNATPNLVVVDGLTNKVINNVSLTYSVGDSRVTILKNSTEISNVTPKIIPTNNSNGIAIKNIVFNNSTKDVTVTLGSSFNDPEDFPFFIGEKVLIEGISVGIETNGKGYNSSNYDYALFTIKSIDPNIGGANGIVTYSLSNYISGEEFPGDFNSFYSSGKIIPESYFPIFNPVLKKNNFYEGEIVYSPSSSGNVESWDNINQYLKVSTTQDFKVNEIIRGKTTGSAGLIKNILTVDSNYSINSYAESRKGWNAETGFLNNNFQRIHDSDYYQYFSYALKSQKDLNTWNNPVSNLNHTAGFKKFGNLVIESSPTFSGISTDQNKGDVSGTADLSRFINLNCVPDFDLASENNLLIDGNISSDEIIFNSRVVQDYIESIGNRVLMIDDISSQFNSNPRSTPFSSVDSFPLSDFRSQKYFIFVRDKKFVTETQSSLVSLIHDNNTGFLNQYGMYSTNNLGFFDFNITGNEGNLLFYPVKFKFNNYHVTSVSFSLDDTVSGVGTTDLGDSVRIRTTTSTIPTGTNSSITIVGIASTYRSSKVLVQIGATDSSYYEYDEITYIHNGSEVFFLDYGQISTDNFLTKSTSGIGTYNAYISGSDVVIDIIPNNSTTVDYIVNTFNVSLANTSLSGIGTQIVGGASLESFSVSIASSASPVANEIASYSNTTNDCSYSIISIEDKTNSQYQICEFLTSTDLVNNECHILEFGTLTSDDYLGITTAGVLGSSTKIYFTPVENVDIDVKVFQVTLKLSENSEQLDLI